MSLQNPTVTVTPLNPSGAAITLPMPTSLNVDPAGNVTLTWTDPQSDLRVTLDPVLSRGVTQHRNRSGYYLVVADVGAVRVQLDWGEWDPWSGTPRTRTATGALALQSHAVERAVERVTVVLYVAHSIYVRATGEVL